MRAFSLVELSIVLVILGLLTGGILTGQSLIRAAELRSVTTQLANYRTAIYSFKDRYTALPGDMQNATKFWGTDPDGCPQHSNWQTKKSATCDGNGDGMLLSSQGQEIFRAWQHLANAGLVEGSYSGVTGPSNTASCPSWDAVAGYNVPELKLRTVGISLLYVDTSAWLFPGTVGNVLLTGKDTGNCETSGAYLTPSEAWNIDTKLDDGSPAYGHIRTRPSGTCGGCAPNCNTATDNSQAATAAYLLSYTGQSCHLYDMLGSY